MSAAADLRRIWLCADDYGISPGVNRAICDLIERGRLNATSVMMVGPAIARSDVEALQASAKQSSRCAIGLHVTLSAPFRLFGIRPSRMNPNTCTICEMAFTKVMKARAVTIDATVMFADLRGYTALMQHVDNARMMSLLDAFYDDCSTAIWHYDGLLNKTIGDAALAIFNFPARAAATCRSGSGWRHRKPSCSIR